MREVNFSIPNVNKASVGITTALYDRRALDCTSTLPLINSLNHLAYLTTSSARIRDILTVDGGVERLVCILKQGRSQEMMEMWKWNLAFQCIFNIGVRGSENVRTRVVEADMVPVIATILDNYIRVIDKCRERVEADSRRNTMQLQQRPNKIGPRLPRGHMDRQAFHDREEAYARRQRPPPSIEIPQAFLPSNQQQAQRYAPSNLGSMDPSPTPPQFPAATPPDRSPFSRHHHHHHHHHHHYSHQSHEGRHHSYGAQGGSFSNGRHAVMQSIAATLPPMEADGPAIRPVRDIDRLPSTLPALQNGITSQPESPTTPNAPVIRPVLPSTRERRRPSLRQQLSNSGDSDDAAGEEASSETSVNNENLDEPMIDIQTTVDIQSADEPDPILDGVTTPLGLATTNASEGQETETFNITHRAGSDGSIINTNVTPTPPNIGFLPAPPPLNVVNVPQPAMPQQSMHTRYLLDRSAPPAILAATPRDEDVLMSLQLLAYVSKYCNLRMYFQQSHLVPKLRINQNLQMFGDASGREAIPIDDDDEEEYLLPDDFNIFPLVEKFTVRHHSQDMQHWAGVVMRNLCRKDDDRGGIRQCAYYQCGKWEKYTRQFAKCRRCRRTKYCSKDCQKNAWVYHRHWCQIAQQQQPQ